MEGLIAPGITLVWLLALILDYALGEPRRWHPLVGFGRYAAWLESRLNAGERACSSFCRGVLAVLLALLPPLLVLAVLLWLAAGAGAYVGLALDALVLYCAIGWRSLQQHAQAVVAALAAGDLPGARRATGQIVSRDTASADESALAGATVESVLENSSDALFASLFWYALGGSVGVVLHRLVNTLDAMWGYRTQRFLYFGRCAARFDDLLNFLPAQCVSLVFCLLAGPRRGWQVARRAWWAQGWRWKSINAGSVMVSGAATLGLSLGGTARYHGAAVERPVLGWGRPPRQRDISAALALVHKALLLWLLVALVLTDFVRL